MAHEGELFTWIYPYDNYGDADQLNANDVKGIAQQKFTLTGHDPWLTTVPSGTYARTLSGTPLADGTQVANKELTMKLDDQRGTTLEQTFHLRVNDVPDCFPANYEPLDDGYGTRGGTGLAP